MAAPRRDLLSVEHLTGMEQNTFTKQRNRLIEKSVCCSRGLQLQQYLQELKEREHKAHQHNRQLLLQFERAQDTLREMLASNAAMKTKRVEYERCLEENFHHWQQRLLEKTQASQRKRMEDRLNLRQSKDQVSRATVDEPLISQDPSMRSRKSDAPQTYITEERTASGENGSSYSPHLESSWLTQAGMVPAFLRASFQPQSSSLFHPPNIPYPHLHLLPNLASSATHQQPCSRPEAAGWDPPCYNSTCTDGFPGGSPGQLHTEELSTPRVSQIVERNKTNLGISKRLRGGEDRQRLSPELDIKPVRLSSGHAESSESDRDSSLTSRAERRRRMKPSSSESERCGSQKSSRTSSKITLRSETNSSFEEGGRSRPRGKGLCSGSVTLEKEAEELNRREEDQMTDSLRGNDSSPRRDKRSESCREEDESDSEVIKSEEVDDEEANSSQQSDTEDRDDEEEEKKNPGSEDGKRENQERSEEGSNVEEDEEEEEEEEDNSGEEVEGGMEDEEDEEQSASSQEEKEEDGGSEEEEDQEGGELRSDGAGDSEDSIISPHESRSKQMMNTPKEAAADEEEESNSQSSNYNSKESSDEDIENLLAPPEPENKKADSVKTEGNPKAKSLNLGIFQVTEASVKTDHKSDSDEFDHFYD